MLACCLLNADAIASGGFRRKLLDCWTLFLVPVDDDGEMAETRLLTGILWSKRAYRKMKNVFFLEILNLNARCRPGSVRLRDYY